MKPIIFALPGNENLAKFLADQANAELGKVKIHQFPDGETYVRILSDVQSRKVFLVCTLSQPNEKILPLYFLSKILKTQGSASVELIAPYLAYMRQDKEFYSGEGITSHYFASLLSSTFNSLITIDPHLHRIQNLNEIYTIPCEVLNSSGLIAKWIKENVDLPLIIGPDSESEQWVSAVAKGADAPYIILKKIRRSDKKVEVSIPHIDDYKQHTVVLVDDIISTATTLIETTNHLKDLEMKPPVCVGIHAVFAQDAFEKMKKAGIEKIATCNTILHPTNEIDITPMLVSAVKKLM